MRINVDNNYFSERRITTITLSRDEALTLIGTLAESMRPIPAQRSGDSYYPHVVDGNGVFVIKVHHEG